MRTIENIVIWLVFLPSALNARGVVSRRHHLSFDRRQRLTHDDESRSLVRRNSESERKLHHQSQPQHSHTVRGIPFPYCRYGQIWQDFHFSVTRGLRQNLGYTRIRWNVPFSHDLEDYSYDAIDDENQYRSIRSHVLCSDDDELNKKVWDCYVNHYYNYFWHELQDAGVSQYFEVLGWTSDIWDGGNYNTYPASEFMAFEDLDEAEQEAAKQLCWFRDKWNGISMDQWDPLPKPPQENSTNHSNAAPTEAPTKSPVTPPPQKDSDRGSVVSKVNPKSDKDGQGIDDTSIFLFVGGVCGTVFAVAFMFVTFYDWPKEENIIHESTNPSTTQRNATSTRPAASPSRNFQGTTPAPVSRVETPEVSEPQSLMEENHVVTNDIESPQVVAAVPVVEAEVLDVSEVLHHESSTPVVDCDGPNNIPNGDLNDGENRSSNNNETGADELTGEGRKWSDTVAPNNSGETHTTAATAEEDIPPSLDDLDGTKEGDEVLPGVNATEETVVEDTDSNH